MLDTIWPENDAPAESSPDLDSSPALQDGEWRRVAILCVVLSDLTTLGEPSEDSEVSAYLNRTAQQLCEVLSSYGGTAGAFSPRPGRGFGMMFTAIFGGQTASENDAERAVRSAIVLYERLHAFNREVARQNIHLEMQIGIHFSHVTSFADGTVEVQENALAVARGLALAAPSEHILVTPEVHTLLADLFHYEGLGAIYIQGSAQPLRAYRVVGLNARVEGRWQRSRLVRRSQMVGRDEELEVLKKIYQDACDPEKWEWERTGDTASVRPTLVGISGPAGSGKSRLLYEFRRVTSPFREGTASPLMGRAASIFPVPYAIFSEMLRHLFGIRGSDPVVVRRRKLETGMPAFYEVDPDLASYLPVLSYLVGIEQGDDEVQSARAFQLEVRIAFTRLLRAVAVQSYMQKQSPLLLYLEDLHGIHERSQSALLTVLERFNSSVPLVIFVTYRPGFRLPAELFRVATVRELPLGPLPPEAERSMIRSMLDGADLPGGLEARVLEKAGGNPYYLEELVRTLVDDRVLVYQQGTWQVEKAVEDVMLPSSLGSLLLARIDQLERSARELLLRASVMGEVVQPEVLEELQSELQGPSAAGLLKALEEARLLRPIEQDGEQLYAFENPLVREVAYQTLVPHNRAVLHRLAARAIERRFSSSLADHYLELANHFRQGEEPARASTYFRLAGEKAQREYANELALSCYTTYLNLSPDHSGHQRVRWRMARVLRMLGRADEAGAVLEALSHQVLPTVTGGSSFLAEVVLELARVRRNIGQLPQAIDLSTRALELAQEAGDLEGQADALISLGKCRRLVGDLDAARQAYQESLGLLERLGDSAGEGRVLSNLGRLALDRGDLPEAQRLFEQALERQRAAEDRWGVALELGHLGEVAYAAGQLEVAERQFELCLSQAEPLEIRPLMAGSSMYLGVIAARRGEVGGLKVLDRGIRIAAALQDLPRQVRGHQLKCDALEALQMGREAQGERMEAQRLAALAGMP